MQETDKAGDKNIVKAGADCIYFQRAQDWVDEDFAAAMGKAMRESGADMAVCGVLRIRGKNYKRGDFYENAELMDGLQGRWKLLRDGYLRYGLCGSFMKKTVWQNIKDCNEEERIIAAIKESTKIVVLNDYKYYYREKGEGGFYEETLQKPLNFSALVKRFALYRKYFPEFSETQVRRLFTRKEWLLLTYRRMGEAACGIAGLMQEKLPWLYQKGIRAADKLMEVAGRGDSELFSKLKENSGSRKILILGTPEYHNLGDHAIAYAQECFVKQFFPDWPIISVTEAELCRQFHTLRRYITEQDILLLQGGGNMGDAYQSIEELRLRIVRSFPGSRIAVMPQTIHLSDKPAADILKKKMKQVYSKHRHLLLNARDYTSYERMKNYFPGCSVNLCPDIVMSLRIQTGLPAQNRKGILLLVRTDAEGTLEIGQLMEMKKLCRELGEDVSMAETSISYGIPQEAREEALYTKWNQIAGARLVITDRLHGMVFAAITGTPCIVLPNFNHKVAESFEWLRGLGYIWFCTEYSRLGEQLDAAWPKVQEQYRYENGHIWKYYEELSVKISKL